MQEFSEALGEANTRIQETVAHRDSKRNNFLKL